MAVSRRLRYEILRRDNHACRYCGATAPDVKLTVDHVVPSALGGSDDPTNLVTACAGCNAGKSASAPDAAIVADVDNKAVQWAQAMNIAIERRTAELSAERKRVAKFDRAWKSWGDPPREGNWKNSINRFLAAGLDDRFLADAVDTAMGNRKLPTNEVWRYFCGICWRELDKIRELTSEIVGATPKPGPSTDPRLPYGPGFHPGFDVLNLAESYFVQVLEHLDVDHEVVQLALHGYWAGLQEAYTEFLKDTDRCPASDVDEVREQLDMTTAYYLYNIQQIHRGQVPNGT